ncbi:NAD-binding protein [Trichocoleus desertorum AS-A10]|uniref:potassium channel family protein n=1 Tax=Trichocoleus desertorum TaxID=1481672 RepID=UPI00329762AD
MESRIIVCSLGRTGYQIFSLLRQQGIPVVGIHDQPLSFADPDVIVGDLKATPTLMAAGIEQAHTLVIASSDDALNLAILMQARILNPQIRVINRLFNTSLGDRLDHTLTHHVSLSVAALAAPVFAFAALGSRAIGQLRLFNQTWPIHEEYIDEYHPWQGRKLSELWDERSRMLIYYLPADKRMDLVSAVIRGQVLQVGDRLIIGSQPNASVQAVRRSWRQRGTKLVNNLRQFQRYGQSMVVVTLVLLVTILIATLTYVCFNRHTSIIDALYFSVGMITGAGGEEQVIEQAPNSIKVFTALMMLLGAGVIGICYALLNDFVLGTRFRQFWDTVQVPAHHHYIVCGLGGVGIQIVQHLRSCGYDVVAIEQDANCRFLSIARALKVPVILGDASLPTTLKAANLAHASALLAVTSNDTANLEIALTAKGLTPKSTAIVRYQDPTFARMAHQVFAFEAVLSPTELVAPTFAAAALGGRILGNGMTGHSLWVALSTLITAGHPFCHRVVKDAAMDADFVPLYLETGQRRVHGWDLLNTCLQAGDVLYLTMPATHLDQLCSVPAPEMSEMMVY